MTSDVAMHQADGQQQTLDRQRSLDFCAGTARTG